MRRQTIAGEKAKPKMQHAAALTHFPAYASFIKNNCLIPYVQEQIRISKETKLPLLKYLEDMSDEQLITMSVESAKAFLTAVEENNVRQHLEQSLERWVADQLGIMKREEITAEDIYLAGHIRKMALLKYLPSYTTDVAEAVEIMKEIDLLTVESDTAATNTYLDLLNERITGQVEVEKQITRRLEESQTILLKANELAHVGHWTWDLPTNKIEWSDELFNIYGISRDFDLTFENIMAFTENADNARIRHNMREAKEKLFASEAYYHIKLTDGTLKVLHAKSETIPDAEGKATRMVGVIQDVTDKQLLIERLQKSEALYKQAEAISHIGNWSWDLKTRKLEWSDELYNIYEVSPGPVAYSGDIGLFNHPEDSNIVRETIGRSLKTLEPFAFNYRIVLPDGRIKTLNARGTIKTDNDGQPTMIYGTVQDITELKAIEKQLKDSREFIKKITDVTPSIIASYNIHTGKYSFVNKAIEKMLGYTVDQVMEGGAAFLASAIHPDDIGPLMERNAKAIEQANLPENRDKEMDVEFKYRMRRNDGSYQWFHTYGTVFERNGEGLVESVLNVSVDITAQESAEQALQQKNLQLQQSNSNLEEYAYVASHDLKEPLRKISTFSDRLLHTRDQLSDDSRNYLAKIISSANRMQQMINDLLAVSTIMGNNAFESSDLNSLLTEALQSLDYKIEETKALVEADQLPAATVVPSQFRQLFQNLISNSLKFAKKDAPPRIRISHKFLSATSGAKLNLAGAARYLQIDVTDNGIGFDNEYAAKIFAIFQRLHSKNEYEGTGIGLSICKKVVENHGGVISAYSTLGKGATFTIVIPMK